MKIKSYKELRWVLRVLSGLIIVFSLLMFIGETFFGENPGKPLTANAILQLSVAGAGLIGLGLAWKWELPGGIISVIAFIMLAIINPMVLQYTLLLIWPLTAILFIVLWVISRKKMQGINEL
ncbi:MAG: hypothetical protein GX126_06385 [Bacteroidales bacterium]|jgi:glucan phosphoethanolaminetransferase (alkaline phosphatase superfamily)|nr:hypothetical protein [Bacteroidales bacterium]